MKKKAISSLKLITIGEAVKLLQVHPNTLRNWDKDGTFKRQVPIKLDTYSLLND
ncbi:MAG: hypothetical protein HYT83_00880 [Candidatus Levybacteria bacterium]|nr:hypothetical protein [Candidatus Levybacteria bacterium]